MYELLYKSEYYKIVHMQKEPQMESSWHYPFKKGDPVKIRRRNGTVEDGWIIHEFWPSNGMITVRKDGLETSTNMTILKELNQ